MTALVELGAIAAQLDPMPEEPLRSGTAQARNLPIFTLAMAIGVLLTSCGFALGRDSKPHTLEVYLIGELVVAIAPLVFIWRLQDLKSWAGFWISAAIGIATFMITVCYSPLVFRAEDEFQHVHTVQNILSTHHLFGFNPSLPISPQYPGLEIVTSEIASLCHLSIYVSGTIVAGICHLLMTVLVYCLATEFRLRPRSAVLAVIIFSVGVDYQFFLSYFVYETFAIPFLLATLVLSLKAIHSRSRNSVVLVAFAAIAFGFVTIVSHHVTSYFMAAALGGLRISVIFSKDRKDRFGRVSVIFFSIVALLTIWDFTVATDTFHYLAQIRGDLFGVGSRDIATGVSEQVVKQVTGGTNPAPQGTSPFSWRIIGDVSAAILALLIPYGAWRIWRGSSRFSYLFLASRFVEHSLLCFGPYLSVLTRCRSARIESSGLRPDPGRSCHCNRTRPKGINVAAAPYSPALAWPQSSGGMRYRRHRPRRLGHKLATVCGTRWTIQHRKLRTGHGSKNHCRGLMDGTHARTGSNIRS